MTVSADIPPAPNAQIATPAGPCAHYVTIPAGVSTGPWSCECGLVQIISTNANTIRVGRVT